MTDEWIPEVSAMTEENDAILHLLRLCRRYKALVMAHVSALDELPSRDRVRVLAIKQELLVSSEQEVEIEYRPVESAILNGTDFVPELQKLLDRHRPINP